MFNTNELLDTAPLAYQNSEILRLELGVRRCRDPKADLNLLEVALLIALPTQISRDPQLADILWGTLGELQRRTRK